MQVARLAAVGYGDRETGLRPHPSPRTVGSHLHRLFPKVVVTSRSRPRDLDLNAQ